MGRLAWLLAFHFSLFTFHSSAQGIITTVAGNGVGGYSGDGGPATSASLSLRLDDPRLYSLLGVAFDRAGNLYIADTFNNRVRRVSADGVISTVAGNGLRDFAGDGGLATAASLDTPTGVAVDAAGNLFISVQGGRVRKVSPTGTITTVAGNGLFSFSGDGGPATNASLSTPRGLAVDSAGNLYIAEEGCTAICEGNGRIRKVSPNGTITTVAGNGIAGSSGDGGPATSASLYRPSDVAVDTAGNLYIAESQRIRRVSPSGIITAVAGTDAFLYGLAGVALDPAGNLYISGKARDQVWRVSREGIITRLAGTGNRGFSGDGAPAENASLFYPSGLAVDAAGSLYISDSGNNRIRKVTFASVTSNVSFEPSLVRSLAPGFYILEATLAPGATPGFWGLEVITSLGQTAGGFNLGGGLFARATNPGFGAFLLSTAQRVTATVNAQLPAGALLTIRFLDSNKNPIGNPVTGLPPLTLSQSLGPGFYIVEVYSSAAVSVTYQLGLAADFFSGGVNTGGYLASGMIGFGAFYVPEPQEVRIKLFGRATYGATGAGDLVLTLKDNTRTVLQVVEPGRVSPAAVTDSSGLVTLASGGVTVPVQLTDPSTGKPIAGVNVALGLPSSRTGLASLFVSDPLGRYPLQFVTLRASTGTAGKSGASKLVQNSSPPAPVSVQSGCPSSLPANVTVQSSIDSIYVPPPRPPSPPSIEEAVFEAELDALNKFASLYGVPLSFHDRQAQFTTGTDCASAIWNWTKSELPAAGEHYLIFHSLELATGLELLPVEAFFTITSVNVNQLGSTLRTCQSWVQGATMRAIRLGNQSLLLVLPAGVPTVSSFVGQPVTVRNAQGQPLPSSLCYVSAGTLGGEFAGTTDSTGTTVVNLQPERYTVGVTSLGYNPTAQDVTVPARGQPVSPLLVTLTATPGGGPLRFTAPATLPAATVGVAYSYSFCDPTPASLTALCGTFPPTLNPTGGTPPYHFQLDSGVGFPPLGISLNLNGILAGTPTADGTRTFRVCTVDLAGAQVCQTASLTVNPAPTGGGGGQPAVTLSTDCLDLRTGTVGRPSDPKRVTLTNSGNAPLSITSITLGGASPQDFRLNHNCPLGPNSTLAAGASCTIEVTFAPSVAGCDESARVTINAPQNSRGIELFGRRPAPPGAFCIPAIGCSAPVP